MSKVRCRGPATACSAKFLVNGNMQKLGGKGKIKPTVEAYFRSPSGRVTKRNVRLRTQGRRNKPLSFSVKVPAPQLWAPESPRLYRAIIKVRLGKTVVQRKSMLTGMRQVSVVNGRLALNNRAVDMRGTSIHEDLPGTGTALTEAGMNRIVADLKAVGANVTRTHYSLNERLLQKLDRAGILVWNEAPVWQRDRLLGRQADRAKAYRQLEGTVIAGRSHPSVITHSVANELVHFPDESTTTSLYLRRASERARKLDPTLPISVAIKTGPRIGPAAGLLEVLRHDRAQRVLRLVRAGARLRVAARLPELHALDVPTPGAGGHRVRRRGPARERHRPAHQEGQLRVPEQVRQGPLGHPRPDAVPVRLACTGPCASSRSSPAGPVAPAPATRSTPPPGTTRAC